MAVFDAGESSATQAELARLIESKLAATQAQVVDLVEQCARVQADPIDDPDRVVGLQEQIVTLGGLVGPSQAVAGRRSDPGRAGGGHRWVCEGLRVPVRRRGGKHPRVPASRMALSALAAGGESDIMCTLEGGTDAMRERIGQWQRVVAAAIGREPADGGITLVFDHDQALTVELARLSAAEFACCSFFTFTLTVGPDGMRFTVTGPDEARDVITSMFGTATTAVAPTTSGEQ